MKFNSFVLSIAFLIVSINIFANDVSTSKRENYMGFGMQVVMTAKPGKGIELSKIMLRASELVSSLEGCLIYIVQVSTDDGDKILITEVWSTQENHQSSLANQGIREIINEARPLIAGMEYHTAVPLGGKGL